MITRQASIGKFELGRSGSIITACTKNLSCILLDRPISVEILSKDLTETLNGSANGLLRTVLYFDVFDHPVTAEELQHFSLDTSNNTGVRSELDQLVQDGLLFCYDGHYSIRPHAKKLVERRRKAEQVALEATEKAYSRSKYIGQFPYVRAAYISGSMAKGVMYEKGDVDFFIITKPGRLWVARTLLILYKKVFLLNSHEFFCVNYFIDSDNLEIEEQNLFSATEAVTLRPIYDSGLYDQFMSANSWVNEYFPNHPANEVIYNGETSRPIAKVIEVMLNNRLGDMLDRFFMKNTLRFWKKKFSHFENDDFEVAMKTRTYVSKHHPRNFQRKVMEALDSRITEFENKHNVRLS